MGALSSWVLAGGMSLGMASHSLAQEQRAVPLAREGRPVAMIVIADNPKVLFLKQRPHLQTD